MNRNDLLIFKNAQEPTTPTELYKKIHTKHDHITHLKTIYTSIYRLHKKGLIDKKDHGKHIYIQQTNIPTATYLNNLLTEYPHYLTKQIFTDTSLNIQLTLLHNPCTAQNIATITNRSIRHTKRHLSKLHTLAIIRRTTPSPPSPKHTWELNKRNTTLIKFLTAYEEYTALHIIHQNDKNASLLWVKGIEFLIKTQHPITQSPFKKTGAEALETYGLKLLPGDTFYIHSYRTLTIWDHAFLTTLTRKEDPTQLRYLAYLYYKKQPKITEFKKIGNYYHKEAMQKILNLYEQHKETPDLKMKDIQELDILYGRNK